MSKKYWHFLSDDGKLTNGDGRKVKVGETIKVEGDPVLHASELITDALRFASGAMVCRVELGGTIVEGDDKAVAQERTVLWMVDATRTLHEFAIWCAEQALGLIENPDPRSIEALKVKRLWLDGKATNDELNLAWAAATSAADTAYAICRAMYDDDKVWVYAASIDAAAHAAGGNIATKTAKATAYKARTAANMAGQDCFTRISQNKKLEEMIMELKPGE